MTMHNRDFIKAGGNKLLLKLAEYNIVHLLNLEPQIAFLFQLVLLSS